MRAPAFPNVPDWPAPPRWRLPAQPPFPPPLNSKAARAKPHYEDAFLRAAEIVLTPKHTCLSKERLYILWQAARNATTGFVPMPITVAEVGCYYGGSAWFIALALQAHGVAPENIEIHLFDTFKGHIDIDPERDGPQLAGRFDDPRVEDGTPKLIRSVTLAMAEFPASVIHVGRFEETSHEVEPKRFAFVHLDTDLYSPTRHGLRFFWPRLVPGGTIVMDDAGKDTCPGVQAAIEEFLAEKPEDISSWLLPTKQQLLVKAVRD